MSTYPGSDLNAEKLVDAFRKGLEVDFSPSERYFPPTRSRYSRHLTAPHSAPAVGQPNMHIEVSRNSLAPINKLPPEVFSRIFEYQYRGSDRRLIAATHVCHQWRSTLTSTPLLWTNLDCRNLEWIATYLERSKAAPLDVRITWPLPSFDVQNFLSSSLWRTRSLCIDLSLDDVRAAILKTRTPAPFLRDIKFQGCQFSILDGSLPPEFLFLARHAPLLRSIRLDACPQLPLPFSLPHLTIFEHFASFRQFTSLGTLLGILSSAPRLRRVSIYLSEHIVEPELDRDQVILLEDLEFFEFRSGWIPDDVLPIMKLPRVKDIIVEIPLGCFDSLAQLLPYGFDSLLAGADKIAYNGVHGRGGIQFDFPGVTVQVGDSGYRTPTAVVARRLSNERLLSYLRVRELTLNRQGSYGGNGNLVADFQNLQILNLIDCEEQYFLRALMPSGGQVPCPLLREMMIVTRSGWSSEWCAFMRVVKARKRAGCALEKVVINRWDGTPEKLPQHVYPALRRYVQVV